MKIAVKSQNAGWILDNIVSDYKKHSRHEVVSISDEADLSWYVNLFAYKKRTHKKNVIYVHHINEDQPKAYNFKKFNTADACIVPSKKTEEVAKKYLDIPVYHFPQWMVTACLEERNEQRLSKLREKVGDKHLLVGSFVKDGNGKRGDTPKDVKDPEKFIDVVKKLNEQTPVKVILAGYARRYTISKLKEHGIPFEYYERYPHIGDLYDLIDCYLVTSKVEGGPQSAYEASYRKVRIFSTDVGVVQEVLHKDCICSSVDDFVNAILRPEYDLEYNYKMILNNHMYNEVIPKIDDFFEQLTKEQL